MSLPVTDHLPVMPRPHGVMWLWPAAGSLVMNLALFALMPYLLHPRTERPLFDTLIPQINVIRIKRPEPPVDHKEARPAEAVPHKTALPPPAAAGPMAPADLKLSFEVNPRLSGGPVVPVAPPMKVTDFGHLGLPAMVAAAELDRPLIALSRMPPVYPPGARRRGIQGWVKVRFAVDTQGHVQEVAVIEAQPPGVFDQSVIRCVNQWRFHPGTVNGTPVRARAETTVRFELE